MITSANLGPAAPHSDQTDNGSGTLRGKLTLCRQTAVPHLVFEGLRGPAGAAIGRICRLSLAGDSGTATRGM
jgi:hypothetical protein